MPPPTNKDPIVLIDTGIVAGIFADRKEKAEKWLDTTISLVLQFNKGSTLVVPTIVCYELARRSWSWFYYVESMKRNPTALFKYINYSLPPHILKSATRYLLKCGEVQCKPQFNDAILAAYCLEYNYNILTENQKHFIPDYFDIAIVFPAPRNSEKESRKERGFLYLLVPKKESWDAALDPQKSGTRE